MEIVTMTYNGLKIIETHPKPDVCYTADVLIERKREGHTKYANGKPSYIARTRTIITLARHTKTQYLPTGILLNKWITHFHYTL